MNDLSSLVEKILVCPDTHQPLRFDGTKLTTSDGVRTYPIVDGIPVLLSNEITPNFWVIEISKKKAAGSMPLEDMPDPETLEGKLQPIRFVREMQRATSGHLYAHLTEDLKAYPIPTIRLPPGNGKVLLDIGSNWGRWVVSAARAGYTVVGVDVHLEGLRAARRVCAQLGVKALLICGDARKLPLQDSSFHTVFSYSVLQHFSRSDFDLALAEVSRVLHPAGNVLIQMPNRLGVRNVYNQTRSGFREENFDVRYYFPSELVRYGRRYFDNVRTSIDGFFGLGIQPTDRAFFTSFGKAVCLASESLRHSLRYLPGSEWLADSLYVHLEHPRRHSPTPHI